MRCDLPRGLCRLFYPLVELTPWNKVLIQARLISQVIFPHFMKSEACSLGYTGTQERIPVYNSERHYTGLLLGQRAEVVIQ
jgi:hypothetical protein